MLKRSFIFNLLLVMSFVVVLFFLFFNSFFYLHKNLIFTNRKNIKVLKRSFIFNLLLAIAFVIGLLFLFFNSLDWLTNHGKQTRVPNLSGKNMNAAIKVLDQQGFKIQIDSTFISYKNPLEVLFQEPEAGANVKVGRTIFLTVNRKTHLQLTCQI